VETKLETKPFPAGGMAGFLANRMMQGNERETVKGNEDAGRLSRLAQVQASQTLRFQLFRVKDLKNLAHKEIKGFRN
jgi:hypothetical protein